MCTILLYIIRHGKPDYTTGKLLVEGERQAELVAERLSDAGISRIYSSPMERAKSTAQPLADRLGLDVEIEPWAYELGDESYTTYPDGKPKSFFTVPAAYFQAPEFAGFDDKEAFENIEAFRQSGVKKRYYEISSGIDDLLTRNGYERNTEGFYIPCDPSERRIALFCHAAMSRIMLAHMLNLPYRLLVATLATWFTGITVVQFYSRADSPFVPRLACYGDVGHLAGVDDVASPFDSEMYK